MAVYGGADPNPIAAYGWEAMELGVVTLAGLRRQAGARARAGRSGDPEFGRELVPGAVRRG